ncbi:aminodeoxychorismate synthase component I [Heyndrickxia oleronia]|uniref:aminodeoxychorismate synthase component I n=1 Tax=Heyndrickxia oleronia TaxID=38875 RepID=UPI003339C19F
MNRKDIMHENSTLYFEFADRNGKKHPKFFCKPKKVIQTYRIDEVRGCMEQIQKEVSCGYYAAGYVSYEAAPAFEPSFKVHENPKMPLLWFGIFDEPIIIPAPNKKADYSVSDWIPSIDGEAYQKGISEIKTAIENGHTYQVNYTTRLHANFTGDDFSFFQKLSSSQDSDYCAYLNLGDYRILSASPELFFRWDGNKIITKPMKGTVRRGRTTKEDNENAAWLFQSEKNRAENVMIVDLLRNDLGNIAVPGTVQVDELFTIEQYPTVLQMTSTISAMTEAGIELVDIFSALFPCGSITGAPKISTMRIISEIEDSPREVYCGAIGFISPIGETIFNVPIRTVVINNQTNQAVYGVGGGVTWDSTTKDEYAEILTKASILSKEQPTFKLLESIKLENGNYFLLDRHIKRLQNSAAYFHYSLHINELTEALQQFAKRNPYQLLKVRVLVAKDGSFEITSEPITSLNKPLQVKLGESPVDKNDLFLYHKTTNRRVYQFHKESQPKVFDVLLWNQYGELTEFTNGNIVLEIKGEYYTPPVQVGLLPGTFREELIEMGKLKERILTVKDIKEATNIYFINSVREWQKIRFV